MRMNRGCGCVLLIVAAVNGLFVIAAIFGVASGGTSIQLGLLALAVFGANLVATLMLSLAALRGRAISAGAPAEEVGEVEGEDGVEGSYEESGEELS